MFDLLDIMAGKGTQTFKGTIYESITGTPSDEGKSFEYEHIEPGSRDFRRLFGNVTASEGFTEHIKTSAPYDFKINTSVRLQNGKWYSVIASTIDYQSVSAQAWRVLEQVAGVEKAIRLVEIEAPWGL